MKLLKTIFGAGLASLASFPSALAHCPLCTVATGAAVAVTRFYGVPDGVVGVFIGAFAISTCLWFNTWLKKHRKEFAMQGQVLALVSLVLTVVSLQVAGLFTGNALFGLPSLLTGTLIGSLTSTAGYGLHSFLRHRANNANLVAYQGVIAVLVSMVVGVVIIGLAS